MKLAWIAAAAWLCTAKMVGASPVVLTFEDLPGFSSMPDGYHGITWSAGQWFHYDSPQPPYNPSSGVVRLGTDNTASPVPISWASPVVFSGSFLNGDSASGSISFEMYLGGSLVATSGSYAPDSSGVGQFLASGYSGLVDRVDVTTTGSPRYFVLDDLSYDDLQAVPEIDGANATLPFTFLTVSLLMLQRRRRRPAQANAD